MPGWQQVGSGFSGIDKYLNVNRTHALSRSRHSAEETDDEIIVEKTPEFKKNYSRERKRRTTLQSHTNRMESKTSKSWKPENLQAAFETCSKTEILTEESEEITWSDSSTAEEVPSDKEAVIRQKRKKKQKIQRYNKQEVSIKDIELTISQCSSNSESTDQNLLFSELKDSTKGNLDCCYLNLKNNVNLNSSENITDASNINVRTFSKKIMGKKSKSQELDSIEEVISDIDIEDYTLFSDSSGNEDSHITNLKPINLQPVVLDNSCFDKTTESQMSDLVCELSSPPSSPQKEVIKASEWVSAAYKSETPKKSSINPEENAQDSGKKNRKFSRSSLSGQLSRLINREKSAVRFWYHSLKAGSIDDGNTKTLTVKISKMRKHFSLYICTCEVTGSSSNKNEIYNITFSADTFCKLELKVDSVIQIFPPWQQLEEVNGVHTLLCTQYVRLLSQPDQARSSSKAKQFGWDAHAVWRCPCIEKTANVPVKCPAACVLNKRSIQDRCNKGNNVSKDRACRLEAVNDLKFDALTELTLLEALERVGSHLLQLPAFSATVLRVFHTNDGYEVLLEDSAGTIALIHQIENSKTYSDIPVPQLEDLQCYCNGLTVVTRTNTEREPELFSIVTQAWRQRLTHHHHSQSQDNSPQIYLKPPSYCYVLKCLSGDGLTLTKVSQPVDNDKSSIDLMERKSLIFTVEDILKTNNTRVTFFGILISVPNSSSTEELLNNCVFVLLPVSTPSGCLKSLKLELNDSCKSCQDLLVAENSTEFYFRDFLFLEGILKCDRYSLAVNKTSWEEWGISYNLPDPVSTNNPLNSASLVPLSDKTLPGSLVSVQGVITEVDESSSCSYETCDRCASQQLALQYNGYRLWCLTCKKPVLFPVIKMEMVVILQSAYSTSRVRVDLTQKTIRILLPLDLSDEGYDIEQVYGQEINLSACLVLKKDTDLHTTCTESKDSEQIHEMIHVKEMEWT